MLYQNNKFIINTICNSCFQQDHINKNYEEFEQYDYELVENKINLYISNKKTYVSKKEHNITVQHITLKLKKHERKKKLAEKLKEMKLEYINGTICDGYIKYGLPNLETVVQTLLDHQNVKNDRLYKLLNKLRKKKLEYNDDVPAYKKYITKGGDLAKTIKDAELEKILMTETDYLSILNAADSETAKEISLSKYIAKGGKNTTVNKYVSKKNTIKFE
jgi:hypothetical protein